MKENIKISKTKKSLLEAIFTLAEDNQINNISVSALCREAGINRTTFYKYYTIPSDVLVEAAKNIAMESENFSSNKNISLSENMLHFCEYFYENRRFINLYFHTLGDMMPIIYQGISMASTNIDFMKKPENNFLAGGITGLAMYWLQRDFQDSPEVIAKLLTEYVENFNNSIQSPLNE